MQVSYKVVLNKKSVCVCQTIKPGILAYPDLYRLINIYRNAIVTSICIPPIKMSFNIDELD